MLQRRTFESGMLPGIPERDSRFVWIDGRTARRGKFVAEVVTPATFRWGGLALEEWSGPAGEIAEGHTTKHMLTLHLSEPMQVEHSWSGRRGRIERVAAGSFCIMPAQVPNSCKWNGAYRAIALEIAPEFLTSIAGGTSRGQVELRPTAAATDPVVSSLAVALRGDALDGCPSGTTYGETLAIALVAHLVKRYIEPPGASLPLVSSGVLSRRALALVTEYVDNNLGEDISVSRLANLVQMNPYQFARSFKRALGTSPHRYIVERRIEFAKAILRTSEMPLSDLALEAGFATPNHFSAVFRSIVGIPPSLYRRSFIR
jgi:AraC family transcriptional regulator